MHPDAGLVVPRGSTYPAPLSVHDEVGAYTLERTPLSVPKIPPTCGNSKKSPTGTLLSITARWRDFGSTSGVYIFYSFALVNILRIGQGTTSMVALVYYYGGYLLVDH